VLESSTTSAKAMLHHNKTGEVMVINKAYNQENQEDVGLYNPLEIFETTVALGKELVEGKEIEAIALSGTWHSFMLCDSEMNPDRKSVV
jgi:gluconokinase